MAKNTLRKIVFSLLKNSTAPLSLAEISHRIDGEAPPRTLRRWLSEWVTKGAIERLGTGRATRYQYSVRAEDTARPVSESLGFLSGLDNDLQTQLLSQIRDLWTHTSTALEGNTLSLGDTHFILQEGLTISGKPIKDHQEVIGHARAIDLLYLCLQEPLTESIVFALHKAVQTEIVTDVQNPNGAWKVEPNGTYMIGPDGRQLFIEYAMPFSVPALMTDIIDFINSVDLANVTPATAHRDYARIHMGIVHIHPFWDGNGRIARLLANIPLLRAGLPPLTIRQDERRTYIQILANYQIAIGQLNGGTGVWPDASRLMEFNEFCASCYAPAEKLVAAAFEIQRRRDRLIEV
jgi:Fic family protein